MIAWSRRGRADTKAGLVAIDVILRAACSISNGANKNVRLVTETLIEINTHHTASLWAITGIDINCASRVGAANGS